jgi:hypothetical protein
MATKQRQSANSRPIKLILIINSDLFGGTVLTSMSKNYIIIKTFFGTLFLIDIMDNFNSKSNYLIMKICKMHSYLVYIECVRTN